MKKKKFFILLQNTFGDLFKLSIDYDHDRNLVKDITLTYFDTILPCISLNIFKSGLLFANVSNNDRILYQFEKLGEEDNEVVIKSVDDLATAQKGVFNYKLKSLTNLAVIDKLQTISPLLDSKIINNSKLLTLSSHSYMKTITHGIPTDTLVESPLSINPTDIFTTKLTSSSTNDEYLIISSSLSSKTIVLSLGENVEDVTDSQMLLDQHTIAIQQIGKSSIVQIYTNGIRHIRSDKKTTDWFPPAGITITHASCNNSQVLIALSNFEVVYFEIDPVDDQLVEYQDRLQISGNITAMTIQSDNKSPFGIIGTSDESLSIISLKNNDCLSIKSIQALSSNCVSLKMMKMGKDVAIHIGMTNGVYARLKIDPINGKLSESRSKYLGTKPVLLNSFRLNVNDALQGILAISSKPWIGYLYDDKFKMTPLIMDDTLSNMCSFINEDVGDGQGLVGLSGDNLVIFSIGKEDDSQFDPSQDFIIDNLKLRYTPRKVVEFEDWMFVTECEYNTKGPYKPSINGDIKENVDEEYYEEFGYEKRDKSWGSCIQVLKNDEIIQSIELKNNESIISSTVVTFTKTSPYLIVAIDGHDKCYLYTYKLGKKNIQFIHKTELDRFPQVLASFQNKLALATANRIQLYDMGQKQLLRKSSTTIPFMVNISKIIPQESRIIISDTHTSSSIAFLKFDDSQNKFIPIADDVTKKQIISMTTLDDNTVIASDKFGNVSISRLDESISRQSEENWTIFSKNLPTSSNSCPYKLTNLCSFYIPDVITGFNVGNLNEIGTSAIVYTGISGLIGLFVPLISKNEIEWLFNLQLLMREKVGCLVGKDHLLFRGYYNPVKNVIDGDLLECYFGLEHGLKTELAQKVNKSIGDIEKKLTDLRNRSAF
ncbi:RSE1 Pre-mRNA-splicing factor RSE1 [Candida maltosa Xu316]